MIELKKSNSIFYSTKVQSTSASQTQNIPDFFEGINIKNTGERKLTHDKCQIFFRCLRKNMHIYADISKTN